MHNRAVKVLLVLLALCMGVWTGRIVDQRQSNNAEQRGVEARRFSLLFSERQGPFNRKLWRPIESYSDGSKFLFAEFSYITGEADKFSFENAEVLLGLEREEYVELNFFGKQGGYSLVLEPNRLLLLLNSKEKRKVIFEEARSISGNLVEVLAGHASLQLKVSGITLKTVEDVSSPMSDLRLVTNASAKAFQQLKINGK